MGYENLDIDYFLCLSLDDKREYLSYSFYSDIDITMQDVLQSFSELKYNPVLMDYLLCVLASQGVLIEGDYFGVVVSKPVYDSRQSSDVAMLRKIEGCPKMVLEVVLPVVFYGLGYIEDYMLNEDNFPCERVMFNRKAFALGFTLKDLLYERYDIRRLGKCS